MTSITGVATDFIQFTRASNATVTDSDGKVKWAPHNLLTNSESFDASSWTKTNATIVANATTAPNGTITADKLVETTAVSVSHLAQQQFTSSDVSYTLTCFMKAAERSIGVIRAFDGSGYATYFNLSTGVVLTNPAGSTASIEAAGNGFYKCTVTRTFVATVSALMQVACTTTDNVLSYTGDGTSGIYVWGAHLYRSDLGGMQANTSAYPMYNPTTPKNLLGYTEDFSNAAWVKTRTSVTANVLQAPNGLTSADKLAATTDTGSHLLRNDTFSSASVTFSVYAKAAEETQFAIGNAAASAGAVFNLSTGTVVSVTAGRSASITAVGDGWYRCAFTSQAGSDTSWWYVSLRGNTTSYTGDGTSGIYLWGAQLSDSASLDSYVPVYGAAVTSAAYYGPRRDFDPVSLACKGLLVEEQRTNLLLQSGSFSAAAWTKVLSTFPSTKLIVNNGSNLSDGYIWQDISKAASATTYTFSVYAEKAEYNRILLLINDAANAANRSSVTVSLVDGSVTTAAAAAGTFSATSATVVPFGTGYIVRLTFTSSTETSLRARIYSADSVATVGDGTSGIFVYWAQLEAGSFATSYIPVGATTAGATRNADVASVSTQAFPYSATESSIVASVVSMGDGNTNIVQLSAANTPFGLLMYQSIASSAAYVDASSTSLGAMTIGTNYKIGIAYNGSSNGAVRNGGTVSSVGTTVSATATKMGIGSGFNGGGTFNGHIRQITYLPRRISNADLQARTSA